MPEQDFIEAIALSDTQVAVASIKKIGSYQRKKLVISQGSDIEWASEEGGGVYIPATSVTVHNPDALRDFLNLYFPKDEK